MKKTNKINIKTYETKLRTNLYNYFFCLLFYFQIKNFEDKE